MQPNLHPTLTLTKNGVPVQLESLKGFNEDYQHSPFYGYKDNERQGALINGVILDKGSYSIECSTPGILILEHTQRRSRQFDGVKYPEGFSNDDNFVKPI